MAVTGAMILPADVAIVPVDELPPEIRTRLSYAPGDHALTRPMSRAPSSVIDTATAALLEEFREPTSIVVTLGLSEIFKSPESALTQGR